MSKMEKSNDLDKYYQNCAYPKPPKTKKKKLLYNGYKDKPQRRCWYTGRPGADRHEIWPGNSFRQTCIDHGFQVDVCREIHDILHANSSEWAKTENLKWKMYYQQKYENELMEAGLSQEQARVK